MIKLLAILFFCIPVAMGIIVIENALHFPAENMIQKVLCTIVGLLFIYAGIKKFIPTGISLRKTKKNSNTILSEFPSVVDEDEDENEDEYKLHHTLSSFRENYKQFFLKDGAEENAAIQNNVTQIFRNILELQRMRLKKKNVRREFSSERKCYGEQSISWQEEFDGKYEIQDVNEDIAAKSVYTKNGRKIFSRVSAECAHYTVISAKQVGESAIICPNCGAQIERSDLLDGCDYCGTKFSVEDIDQRISDFSLRKNYDAEYKKFTAFRDQINKWITFIAAIIAIIAAIMYLARITGGEKPTLTIYMISYIFAVIIATWVAVIFGRMLSAIVTMPVVMLSSSAFVIKKAIEKSKQKTSQSDSTSSCIDKIRRYDPLFSITNFRSSVTNKLATIIYAENKKQSEAFYAGSKELDVSRYKNVIEFDVLEMQPVEYKVDGGMQHISVDAELELIDYDGNKCRPELENIRLSLVKSAECKTQSVCAPSIMTCKDCGASRSLLDGKACPQCGREIDFSQYDWVIDEISY